MSKHMRQLKINDRLIHYELKYSQRKKKHSIRISVDFSGNLTVSAHPSMREDKIAQLLLERSVWIEKHIVAQKSTLENKVPLDYQEGSRFDYLGLSYCLTLLPYSGPFSVAICDDKLCVSAGESASQQYLMRKIDSWYRSEAYAYFSGRIEALLPSTPWVDSRTSLKVRKMRRQWGNYRSTGQVTLNLHLIKLPPYLIDYVILHELCHIQEPNHNRRFYQLLKGILPAYKSFEQAIKHYAYHLYELN